MKAAIFREPHKPLTIENMPVPELHPGDVLVRVIACGVCHTDLHYIDHDVPTFQKPPIILGHEISGVIEKAAPDQQQWKPGDRVLLPAVLTCGSCKMCRLGRENICSNMMMFGNHRNGGYAEFVTAPGKDIFRLPDEIPLVEGCIIADALSTPYHAVKNRARVRPGDKVVVFGCGGVGLNVVQLAAATGATVVAVDIKAEKLEIAKQLGAWQTLDAGAVDVKKQVRKIFDGGADIAIEAIGNPATIEMAFESLNTGGRLCVVGYSEKSAVLNAPRLMFREMEIVGSLGCRPVDYPNIIQMVAHGRIQLQPLVTHRFALESINEALDTLRRSEGLRSVIRVAEI
jgi:6-hydroxycyclohex-1-ene-1-carbonyl-CoA dehydrogenase